MAFFPALSTGDLNPFFRMLDDSLRAHETPCKPTARCNPHPASTSHPKSRPQQQGPDDTPLYRPAFDVKEYKDHYELQGELPGVAQSAIDMEFTDPQTLRITGRSERVGTTAAGTTQPTAIESAEPAQSSEPVATSPPHQPSVEDAPGAQESEDWTAVQTPSTSNTAIERQRGQSESESENHVEQPRYWLSERTVGRFQRVFSFPDRVDAERVSATLKDGVLSVLVPKAPEPARVKISIR